MGNEALPDFLGSEIMHLVLYLFKSLLLLLVSSQAAHIRVDNTTGNDTVDCWNGSLSCQTLAFALEGAQRSDPVVITLTTGTHVLAQNNSLTALSYKTGFGIVGQTSDVVIACEAGAGFSFSFSTNIQFYNVTFSGCGVQHNSTSRGTGEYLLFRAAIYFLFCSNVVFDHVVVSDSTGTGVVFYSTVGNNSIRFSNFTNNYAKATEAGGGGMAVEFVYCTPGDSQCNNTHGSILSANYTNGTITEASYDFNSCHFSHNIATDVYNNSYIVPHASNNVALGRGGGLSVVYKGIVNQIPLHITNCVFYNNTAIWGGGLLIEFQDQSANNAIIVQSSIFQSNQCGFFSCTYQGTGGGGARVLFAGIGRRIQNNSVLFSHCNFSDNRAYFGGGVSFLTFRENVSQVPNSIHFESCLWQHNVARLGSAIDLSVWHLETVNDGSLIIKPVFANCVFESNSIDYTEYPSTPAGIGTVYMDSISIQLRNKTNFTNNDGSAIASLDAVLEFGDNSVTIFNNNTAQVGGGVTLFNKAFILLNNNSTLKFTGNVAFLSGGAIYWESIGDHQLISSRNCFIRYFDADIDPVEWPVHITFDGNRANLSGHAIYATTILGCLWGGRSYGNLVDPRVQYLVDQVFCWNASIWNYGVNTSCNDTGIIATSPAYYADRDGILPCQYSYSSTVIPGKLTTLPVLMLDDRLNQVPNNSIVFSVYRNSSYYSVTEYTTYKNISYFGNPQVNDRAELYLKTIHPRVVSTKIDLIFDQCPPGYIINPVSLVCEGGNYPNIRIRSNFTAAILFGYWMGTAGSKENGLLVGQCFYCPQNAELKRSSFVTLPESSSDLDEFFCDGLDRKGITCSLCKENFSVAVTSTQFTCVPCPDNSFLYSWVLYLLAEYLPLTVMLTIVIVFNISVTSGPANAFIFFAQIISTTFGIDANGIIDYRSITPAASAFTQIYISIYGFWNLSFLAAVDFKEWLFCLAPNMNALHLMALKFVSAFFPLFVIGFVALLFRLYNNNYRCIVCIVRPLHKLTARCFHFLNLQRSLMDAFATFIILSYVRFAVTSCELLYPNAIVNATGHTEFISLYNGELHFFSAGYAPYLVVSLFVVFLCLLLPFLLLLYSIKPWYSCLERANCRLIQPGDKAQQFLDSFHQCFKDGRDGEHDRRYFAALYFFFKFSLIATYAFGLSWTLQYVFQQFICTIALLLLGSLQPYKKTLHNVLDLAMFSILSAINVITLYNYYLQAINQPLSAFFYSIQIILIFIPLVYFVIYVTWFLYSAIKKRQAKRRRLTISGERHNFSFSTFMADVDIEDRFKQNNYYGPLISDEYTQDLREGDSVGHNTLEFRRMSEADQNTEDLDAPYTAYTDPVILTSSNDDDL